VRLSKRCISWGRFMRIRLVSNLKYSNHCVRSRAMLVLIWSMALASALILYRLGANFQSHTALIGLGSAFGGAAGNLSDILRRRSIIDFIDLGWWPAFNLADAAITGGIALAFWS